MFFHQKNLKSENNNPWFKPWFNILLHTQSFVCATVDCQCLEYLGYITLTYPCPNPWHDSLLDQSHLLHQILANKLCWHCHWVRIPISNVKEQCHLTENDLQQIQGGSLWIEHRDLDADGILVHFWCPNLHIEQWESKDRCLCYEIKISYLSK